MSIEYGPDFNPRGGRTATEFILLHCSATPNSRNTPAEAIVRYHMDTLGWRSCGYHLVIERSGAAVETLAPEAIGAHARGLNGRSFGICLIGGLDDEGCPDAGYTAAQWEALAQSVGHAKRVWPDAEVMGHRDAIARGLAGDPPKACPCFDAVAWWRGVAEEIADNDPGPAPDGEKLRLDRPLTIQSATVLIQTR